MISLCLTILSASLVESRYTAVAEEGLGAYTYFFIQSTVCTNGRVKHCYTELQLSLHAVQVCLTKPFCGRQGTINITIHSQHCSVCSTIERPRTRVGQPKIKQWKLHELHKNEVKNLHPIWVYAQIFGNLKF